MIITGISKTASPYKPLKAPILDLVPKTGSITRKPELRSIAKSMTDHVTQPVKQFGPTMARKAINGGFVRTMIR